MMATRPTASTLEAEKAHLARERSWLFTHIFPRSLPPIREGLQECSDLLAHAETTLPLTSRATERLKGIVTRQGGLLVKGDIRIRLPGVPAQRVGITEGTPVVLTQVTEVMRLVTHARACCAHALQEDTARRIVHDVLELLKEASDLLRAPKWTETFPLADLPGERFRPSLQEPVAMDLCVREASLVADVWLLQDRKHNDGFLARLNRAAAGTTATSTVPAEIGGLTSAGGNEVHGGFVRFRGRDVKVVQHIRVESQDPALVAVMTKLSALTHSVEQIALKIAATSI